MDRNPLEAQLNEAENSLSRIHAFVASAEATARQVRRAADQLTRVAVTHEIEAGVGTVVMNAYGQLVKVNLNAEALAVTDMSRFGQRVVDAINAAEAKAEQLRKRRLGEIARSY